VHAKWLAGKQRTTILLQRNQSFGEMLDKCISVAGDYIVNCKGTQYDGVSRS